ncbi:basement membrane-specific heparan sulfate proteoglycan core, partial, partial [Paramuricea clavata]
MPDITWQKGTLNKGTRNLVNGPKYVMSNFNKRLTIKNLNTADNGNYVCTISRAANSKIHQATLTVIETPVIKDLYPANQ